MERIREKLNYNLLKKTGTSSEPSDGSALVSPRGRKRQKEKGIAVTRSKEGEGGLFELGFGRFQPDGEHACYRDGHAIALGGDGWQK